MKPADILIVEDEVEIADLIRLYLINEGFTVLESRIKQAPDHWFSAMTGSCFSTTFVSLFEGPHLYEGIL